MTGYTLINLKLLLEEAGEDAAKNVLSAFSCPLNGDVECFLRSKAIEFSKQGISQTHLVMAPYQGKSVLVGYFTLANKYIRLSAKVLRNSTRRRLAKFAVFDNDLREYC